MNEIISSVIAFAIGGIAYIALIVILKNKRKRRTTAEIIESLWAKMNKQDKGEKVMSQVIYKKCPKCGATMVKDNTTVYTSLPPQYRYTCPECGEVEFDTDPPQGFPTIKVEPDIVKPAPFPSGFTWDEYRREAAKDILCALIIHCSLAREDGARIAIEYADELIKQLKEEKK